MNPVEYRARQTANEEFWRAALEGLQRSPPCFLRVLGVIGDLKDKLIRNAGSRDCGDIENEVDMAFIQQ